MVQLLVINGADQNATDMVSLFVYDCHCTLMKCLYPSENEYGIPRGGAVLVIFCCYPTGSKNSRSIALRVEMTV